MVKTIAVENKTSGLGSVDYNHDKSERTRGNYVLEPITETPVVRDFAVGIENKPITPSGLPSTQSDLYL